MIAIISLLSSVVLASLNSARDKGRVAAGMQFSASMQNSLGADAVVKYNFEEGSGAVALDSSGLGNHANISLAARSTDTYHSNNSKNSLFFNGAGHLIDTTLPLGISNTNFTITLWIKTTSSISQMYVIANATGGNGYRFGLSGGKIAFLIGNAGGGYNETTCGSKQVNDGKWHNIAGEFDRTGLVFKCYIDGELAGKVTLLSKFADMLDDAPSMGSSRYCCYPFVGNLDDIRIYASNLGLVSIAGIYEEEKSAHLATNY